MKFKISSKEEAKEVRHLVENLAGDFILISSLREKYQKLSEKEFYSEIKKIHKKNKKEFDRTRETYENIWNKNKKKYLQELEKIFGHSIKDNKTGYIVPSLWINIADVIKRKNAFFVASEKQIVPLDFIIFHEFTHLHYSDELTKLKLYEAGESPLMEGVAHLILFKSPLKKLFKEVTYEDISFVQENQEFMKELESIWENRKDFKSFLEKAIKIQRKMGSEVKICRNEIRKQN